MTQATAAGVCSRLLAIPHAQDGAGFVNYDGLRRTHRGLGISEGHTSKSAPSVRRPLQVQAIFGGTARRKVPEPEPKKQGTGLFQFGVKKPTEPEEKSSGGTKLTSLIKVPTLPKQLPFVLGRTPDAKTVFVAGATGQTGARVAKELLGKGLTVRAGVLDLEEAQSLAAFASKYEIISRDEVKRLNVVQFDIENAESVAKAIGNASKVVITLGPSEGSSKNKVSAKDALTVLEAAKLANTSQFVLVSSKGSSSSGGGGGFFDLLFGGGGGVSDKTLLDKLAESDVPYTVVRSSSELSDSAVFGTNLVVAPEGSAAASGKISKIQVAAVVAEAVASPDVSLNKVFDVAASEDAPASALEDLLSAVPVDPRLAVIADVRAKVKAEAEEAVRRQEELVRQEEAALLERERRAEAEVAARLAAEEARDAAAAAADLEAQAKVLAAVQSKAATTRLRAQQKAEQAAEIIKSINGKAEQAGISSLFTSVRRATSVPASAKKAPAFALPAFNLPSFGPDDDEEEVVKKPQPPRRRAPPPPKRAAPVLKARVSAAGRNPTSSVKPSKPAPKPARRPAAAEKPSGTKKAGFGSLFGLAPDDYVYED